MRTAALGSAVVVSLALLSGVARAQSHDAATADALFREARSLMKKGDFATACPKLEESYRLDPAPGTGVNLGDCFEKQGKVASALLAYQAARALLPAGDPRVAPVSQQIAALEKRVPHLTIKLAPGAPEGTTVRRDGRKLDSDKLGTSMVVNPGQHTIVVSAPGRDRRSYYPELDEGEVRELAVEAGEPTDAERSAAEAPSTGGRREERKAVPQEQPTEGSSQRTLGYVVGGAGVAMLAVSAWMYWGKAQNVGTDCTTDQQCANLKDEEQGWRNGALGAGIVGAAGLAGGIALVLLAPEPARTSSILGVGPTLTRAGYGLNLGGTW